MPWVSRNEGWDYSILAQAWAEHMPDTIPPNILAVMNITGDHWSSRWWAHRAQIIVDEGIANMICAVQQYWMGGYSSDPMIDKCGKPVVPGAAYWNTTHLQVRVYDGAQWRSMLDPVPGTVQTYVYTPIVPTNVFTGPDLHGNSPVFEPLDGDAVAVFLNGVRLVQTLDYSVQTNQITLMIGSVGTPNIVELEAIAGQQPPQAPYGNKIDTSLWTLDGTNVSFPLVDIHGNTIEPASPADCIVSVDGTIQDPGVDYTISLDRIVFASPPRADATCWMVAGLPVTGGTLVAAPPLDLMALAARVTALEARLRRMS